MKHTENKEKYKVYLNYLKEYRNKKRLEMLMERANKIKNVLNGEKYSLYFSKSGSLYYITDKSIIYNKFGKERKLYKNKNGYKNGIDGKMLHRVVWESFNGKIQEGYEIDHIIPIKNGGTDELVNLRIVTHKENCNNPISLDNYSKHNKTVDRSYLKKKF